MLPADENLVSFLSYSGKRPTLTFAIYRATTVPADWLLLAIQNLNTQYFFAIEIEVPFFSLVWKSNILFLQVSILFQHLLIIFHERKSFVYLFIGNDASTNITVFAADDNLILL